MKTRTKPHGTDHGGSTFDSFLEQEEIREDVERVAIKRVFAWQRQKQRRAATAKVKPACTCR